jgi:hypothetical protein
MKTNSEINEWIHEEEGLERLRRMIEMDSLTFGFGGGFNYAHQKGADKPFKFKKTVREIILSYYPFQDIALRITGDRK